jgi:hypothetical protein
MRVCQFRHDGKWTQIAAAAKGHRVKTCTSILQARTYLSNACTLLRSFGDQGRICCRKQ